MSLGNCYVASEALYHLMGGKAAGWVPINGKHEGVSHWALRNGRLIVDVTVSQFDTVPDYSTFKGKGFLTKEPSRRAARLMEKIQERENNG